MKDRLASHGRVRINAVGAQDLHPVPARRRIDANINALHWGRDEIAKPLAGHIDKFFLSYETGLVKPDREAFEQVTTAFDCRPDEVLFFDDSPLSVSAAADYGIDAVNAIGIDAVRETLVKRGVLD